MAERSILSVEMDRGVVVLKLNRPEVMNAFNFSLLIALKNEIERLRFDNEVRVVVITGEGERAFCAGADLK